MSDLAALQQETGNLVGEPRTPPTDGTRFTNADFTTYLNEGADELNRLAGVYRVGIGIVTEARKTIYLVQDAEGNPPLGKVLLVENSNGILLEETSKAELNNLEPGWAAQSGTPTHWYPDTATYGGIGLWPTPDAVLTFTVFIPAKATAMSAATDTPWVATGEPTLQQYHYALPYYAAYKCLSRKGPGQDEATAKERKAVFDGIVAQAQADPLGMAVAA